MKKRLLTMALAAVFGLGAYAYNAGDYLYTTTAKFKLNGNNVANNNFADPNQWGNGLGGGLASNWMSENAEGPDGTQILTLASLDASTEEGSSANAAWELANGVYAISFWVYSPSAVSTSISDGGNNFLSFNCGVAGETARQINEVVQLNEADWTQITDTIQVNTTSEILTFQANKVTAGIRLAQFEIFAVDEVYDTRAVDRLIAFGEKLLAEPDLAEGQRSFQSVITRMKQMKDTDAGDDIATMEGLVGQYETQMQKFLSQNGGAVDAGDWSTRGGANWNTLNNTNLVGSYSTIGVRWGFFPNAKFARNSAGDMADLERQDGEGYILSAGIQRSFDLGAIGLKVENANWGAGKYLFSIEAQEVAALNSSAPYGNNYSLPFIGPSMFIGTDTLVMRPATEEELAAANPNFKYAQEADTLSGYYWKRYYMIGEVKEGANVNVGFIFPAYADKRGGKASLRNPMLYKLGQTEQQLKYATAVKSVVAQQKELKKRLDTYQSDVAAYKWGKDSVDRAVADAQSVYEQSLAVVNPETEECFLPNDEENIETSTETLGVYASKEDDCTGWVKSLLSQVNKMGRAKNFVTNSNAIQNSLQTSIAAGNTILAKEYDKEAPTEKAALQTAVNNGQSLLDNLTDVNDTAQISQLNSDFQEAINNISASQYTYEVAVASGKNPAEFPVVNPFFAINKGQKSRSAEGWEVTGQTDNGTWKFDKSDWYAGFENNSLIRFDRGNTAFSKNKVRQLIKVTDPGMYEFICQAYAYNNYTATQNTMKVMDEEGNPTGEINSGCKLFFGKAGEPDSLSILTDSVYNKNAQEWQLVSSTNKNGNVYTNSDNTSYQYSSPWAPYYKMTYAKETAGEEELEFGFSTMDNVGACDAGFGSVHIRFCGSVADYLAGVNTVSIEKKADGAIYSITGVKLNAVPAKGLYIQNGKKFVVK